MQELLVSFLTESICKASHNQYQPQFMWKNWCINSEALISSKVTETQSSMCKDDLTWHFCSPHSNINPDTHQIHIQPNRLM